METKKLQQIVIDNKTRCEKGLSVIEYCTLLAANYCHQNKLAVSQGNFYELFGIDKIDYNAGLRQLKDKKILTGWSLENPNNLVFDESYLNIFNTPFEKFWEKYHGLTWPGSKKQAIIHFDDLVKKVGGDLLIQKKEAYFDYIITEATVRKFNRQVMMATVFLNAKTERFMEPWDEYAEQIKNPAILRMTVTPEEVVNNPTNNQEYKDMFSVIEESR
jgi:hypothetical protein